MFDSTHGEINDEVIPYLSQLQAPLGKYAVLGNHDLRLDSLRVKHILEQSGFVVLVNGNRTIQYGDGRIHVVGIDEMFHGRPNLPLALEGLPKDEFILLLAHEPDFAEWAIKAPIPIDLQLSGHSHGGQIRIPFYGSVFTPDLGKRYSMGLYSIKGTDFKVYTNRGIGTTLLPIRFNCKPEITVYDLSCT
ncbi:putative metallophosphoesterase [compost metagenome]